MNKKAYILTVGIPAYNEEKNIEKLLNDILSQQGDNFILKKIFVISDGSTDSTAEKIIKISDKRVHLEIFKQRIGKSAVLGKILANFDSDILFLIDADTFIPSKDTFANIFRHADFEKSSLIAPMCLPLDGKNFFEKTLNYSVQIQNEIKEKWNKGNNYLVIRGCFIGLSKNLAKSVTIPSGLINDDAYIYFKAIQLGYKSKYIPQVRIFYRSPSNLRDHIMQSSRFQKSYEELQKYFLEDIKKQYQIPKFIAIRSGIKYLVKNPILFLSYVAIFFYTKINKIRYVKSKWYAVQSTKAVVNSIENNNLDASFVNYKFKLLIFLRNVIYFSLYNFDKYIFRKKSNIVILCYHSVSSDNWRFSINYSSLVKQIEYLRSQGYNFITLDDVKKFIDDEIEITKPSVVISFDDGYSDLIQTISLFKKYNIQPTLFLLANSKNANRQELETERPFLNKEDIQLLEKNGWDIQCHSGTHADLSRIDKNSLKQEVSLAKKEIETYLNKKISYFAYPKGRYNEKVLNEVKQAGYKMGLSMDDDFISPKTNIFAVPRVGIDRTHTITEFKATFSPSVIRFRKFIKHKLGINL